MVVNIVFLGSVILICEWFELYAAYCLQVLTRNGGMDEWQRFLQVSTNTGLFYLYV